MYGHSMSPLEITSTDYDRKITAVVVMLVFVAPAQEQSTNHGSSVLLCRNAGPRRGPRKKKQNMLYSSGPKVEQEGLFALLLSMGFRYLETAVQYPVVGDWRHLLTGEGATTATRARCQLLPVANSQPLTQYSTPPSPQQESILATSQKSMCGYRSLLGTRLCSTVQYCTLMDERMLRSMHQDSFHTKIRPIPNSAIPA